MKPLQRIQANPANSIVIVIDIQNEFCKPGGVLFPENRSEDAPTLIPAARRVIDGAGAVGVPVIYVQSVHTLLEPEFTVFDWSPRHTKYGTWNAEFVDELTPEPRDIIVRKWTHDPWYKTDLQRILDGLVPDPTKCQAIITGGAMIGCAHLGGSGFYIRNYQTVFVMDAVYGRPMMGAEHFSRTSYPTYPNVYFSRSDLIEFSKVPDPVPAGR